MIKALNTRVIQNPQFYVVKRCLSLSCPQLTQRFGVLMRCNTAEGQDTKLKIWDELTVKLTKANELSNVSNLSRFQPSLQKDVLRVGGPITIRAHVDANEFKTCWEYLSLFQAQQQMIRLTHHELKSHIQ